MWACMTRVANPSLPGGSRNEKSLVDTNSFSSSEQGGVENHKSQLPGKCTFYPKMFTRILLLLTLTLFCLGATEGVSEATVGGKGGSMGSLRGSTDSDTKARTLLDCNCEWWEHLLSQCTKTCRNWPNYFDTIQVCYSDPCP